MYILVFLIILFGLGYFLWFMEMSDKKDKKYRRKESQSLQKIRNHIESYPKPRSAKDKTREKILSAYVTLLEVGVGIPTQAELMSYTGLSRFCIQQHLEEMKTFLSEGDACLPFKAILLNKIFKTAIDGDVKAMRLGAEILKLNEQNQGSNQVMNQQVIYEVKGDDE